MITMKVLGLTLDGETNNPILVLQQEGGTEILPIWIGTAEALSISVVLNSTDMDRPVTHETMHQLLRSLDVRIVGVDIIDVRKGTYFADLILETAQGKIVRQDCRPSDGIALAIRDDARIRVAASVLKATSSTRSAQRGEDFVTAFTSDHTGGDIPNGMFQLMEPPSRYKM